jgi:group I intron endonuclease
MIITVASFKGGETITKRGVSGIYATHNAVTGKSYIGSAISLHDKFYNHLWHLERGTHRNRKLLNSWRKHGMEAFSFEILETLENVEHLIEREQHWIKTLNSCANGYNLNPTAGSNLGREFGKEYCQTLSNATRKAMADPEVKERHRAATRAAMARPEVREKCRQAILKRNADPVKKAALVASQTTPEAMERRIHNIVKAFQIHPRARIHPKKVPRAPIQYEVITPDGESRIVVNLKAFCRANDLPYPSARNAISGRTKTARGHIVRKVVQSL